MDKKGELPYLYSARYKRLADTFETKREIATTQSAQNNIDTDSWRRT